MEDEDSKRLTDSVLDALMRVLNEVGTEVVGLRFVVKDMEGVDDTPLQRGELKNEDESELSITVEREPDVGIGDPSVVVLGLLDKVIGTLIDPSDIILEPPKLPEFENAGDDSDKEAKAGKTELEPRIEEVNVTSILLDVVIIADRAVDNDSDDIDFGIEGVPLSVTETEDKITRLDVESIVIRVVVVVKAVDTLNQIEGFGSGTVNAPLLVSMGELRELGESAGDKEEI